MERCEISAKAMLEALILSILESGTGEMIDGSYYETISPLVEQDTTATKSAADLARELAKPRAALLDFGCGTGPYRPKLESFGYQWQGVNYKAGMGHAVVAAAEADENIMFYDGLILPFVTASFDAVYSFQVFEHIQDIGTTFGEIARVLKASGSLIGSVSQLEQIHDFSTYNFTPYGLKMACDTAGLRLVRIYPNVDAFTFLVRRLLVSTSASDDNSLTSELHADNAIGRAFVKYGEKIGFGMVRTNLLRLKFAQGFTFHAVK